MSKVFVGVSLNARQENLVSSYLQSLFALTSQSLTVKLFPRTSQERRRVLSQKELSNLCRVTWPKTSRPGSARHEVHRPPSSIL